MSYDPYDPYSNAPSLENRSTIRGRVQAPGIALIVVGVLNVFWALYMLVNGVMWTVMPDYLIKSQQEVFPGLSKQNAGKTRDEQMMQGILVSYPWALLAFLASVLPIAGGVRMMSLKSYGLALTGAISAAVPCVSATACCGLGLAVGIWALVVLLNPDVRDAFQ